MQEPHPPVCLLTTKSMSSLLTIGFKVMLLPESRAASRYLLAIFLHSQDAER